MADNILPAKDMADLQTCLNKVINAMNHLKKAKNFNGIYGALGELQIYAGCLSDTGDYAQYHLKANNPQAYEQFKVRLMEEYRKEKERNKNKQSKAA